MLIVPLEYYPEWGPHKVPPVGSIGEISVGLDEYHEYEVNFDGYPHPAIDDSDWIVHKSWIIPIGDEKTIEFNRKESVLIA